MENSQYNGSDQWSQATWSQTGQDLAEDSQKEPEILPLSSDLNLSSTLLKVPSNIRLIRDQVFHISEPVTWTAKEFYDYWGYMDNFWVLNSTQEIKKGRQTLNSWCRLWRDSALKTQGSGHRAKRICTTEPCRIKLNMYKLWDEKNQLVSVEFSRNELKSRGKEEVCYTHNHTLEYLDIIKVNSKVKSSVGTEIAKGYRPSDINRNIKKVKWAANKAALGDAGGAYLDMKGIHNAGASWKLNNPDHRIIGARIKWEGQLAECLTILKALSAKLGMSFETLTVKKKTNNLISQGIVFGKLSRLKILMRRGHLTIMDATHNTNRLHWKLFTIMVRYEYGNWIPRAHMLCEHEDDDIIPAFLAVLQKWCGGEGGWQPQHFITNNSAAEQHAVSLAFDTRIEHFLSQTHFERTLTRNLASAQCKEAKSHLYAALYLCHTEAGFEESILAAIAAAPKHKQAYIKQK